MTRHAWRKGSSNNRHRDGERDEAHTIRIGYLFFGMPQTELSLKWNIVRADVD
jgi:hypothetical protein